LVVLAERNTGVGGVVDVVDVPFGLDLLITLPPNVHRRIAMGIVEKVHIGSKLSKA